MVMAHGGWWIRIEKDGMVHEYHGHPEAIREAVKNPETAPDKLWLVNSEPVGKRIRKPARRIRVAAVTTLRDELHPWPEVCRFFEQTGMQIRRHWGCLWAIQ